jgi:hypothetical protein
LVWLKECSAWLLDFWWFTFDFFFDVSDLVSRVPSAATHRTFPTIVAEVAAAFQRE